MVLPPLVVAASLWIHASLAGAFGSGAAAVALPRLAAASKGSASCEAGPTATVCETLIGLIELGQQVRFVANRSLPQGTPEDPLWTAGHGLISPEGIYTAPATMPPDAIDTIDYSDPVTGVTFSTTIRLVPTSRPPAPGAPSPAFETPTNQETNAEPPSHAAGATIEEDGEMAVPDVEYTYSQHPTAPLEVREIQAIEPVTLGNESAYPWPTSVSSDPELRLYAASLVPLQRGKKCPVLPTPDWIEDPRRNGILRAVVGRLNQSVEIGQKRVGSVTVSAELSARIKSVLGLDVEVGAVFDPVTLHYERKRQWYNVDYYKCVKGKWVFSHSRQCSRMVIAYIRYDPAWAWLLWGNKPPLEVPSSWACKDL
jgi:hypothetical protein